MMSPKSPSKMSPKLRLALLTTAAAAVFLGSVCGAKNKAPSVPVISGPTSGIVGVAVTFKAVSADPDGDSVAYQFDWGDSSSLAWTSFIPSGDTAAATHTFTDTGAFTIRVKAKDTNGDEGEWSGGQAYDVGAASLPSDFPDSLATKVWVGGRIYDMCISPDGQRLYIADKLLGRLLVMRTTDYAIVDTLLMRAGPMNMALSPDGALLYSTNQSDDSLYVVRTSDNTIAHSAYVGAGMWGVAASPDGERIFIANSYDSCVLVLRASDFVTLAEVPVDPGPYGLGLNRSGTRLYVTSPLQSSVTMLSTQPCSVLARAIVGVGAYEVTVAPRGDSVYVSCPSESLVSVLAATRCSVLSVIRPGGTPAGLAFVNDGRYLAIANDAAGGLPIVDVSQGAIAARLPSDGRMSLVESSPAGDRLYAVDKIKGIYVYVRRGQR